MIAAEAGVSVMTVSRALREDTFVSPKLRALLRKKAALLGYRPDPLLSALSAYRKRIQPPAEHTVIGFLTAEDRASFQASTVTRDAFLGAVERGREMGYRLELLWLSDLAKRHRNPSAVLLARGIRGLILSRLPEVGARLDLDWAEFSCVAVGYSLKEPAFNRVASHQFQDVILAFEQARAMGYRRPALLLSTALDERTQHQFYGAFLYSQQALAQEDRLPIMWSDEIVRAEDLAPFMHRHRPDVLLSIWPLAKTAVRKLKLRVPQEVGFIDLCLEDRNAGIAGIYQDFHRIGRAAVDSVNLLLQIWERGAPAKSKVTVIYGEWVEGKTVRVQRSP